jgi:outer membrane protein TolC
MRVSILIFLFFVSQYSFSQDSIFTSKDAVNVALQQNLEIQIAQSDLDVAEINNNWGNAGGLPTITSVVNNTEAISNINQKLSNGSTIQRNNVSNNTLVANLAISWRIFNGMRVRATKDRFESIEKMGTLMFQQQIDQVVFEVLNVYNNLIRLNKQIIATRAIIELSKERLKIAETRFNVGNGAKTDMLQARIDLNNQEINLENILKQIQNTKAAMNALLKRNADAPFVATEEQFQIPSINFDTLQGKIETQNYSLLIAQQEKINLLIDKKIINSQRIPTATFSSVTTLNKSKAGAGFFLTNQTFGPNVGIGIGIPLFNSNINRTQAKVNKVLINQQDLQIDLLRTNLKRDLFIAYQEYQNAITVSKMEEKNVKFAEENNFISTERFKKLQSNAIELRQAQLSLIEAQDRYINAQYRALVAGYTLQFLTGEISKSNN